MTFPRDAPREAAVVRPSAPLVWAILASVVLLMLATAAPALSGAAPAATLRVTSTQGPAVRAQTGSASLPILLAFPDWINVTNPAANASPPAGFGGAMAYDPADNITLYFGGCGPVVCPNNQTWAFSNGRWVNLTDPRDSPPARYYESMDYDANMGGVLMFGGSGTTTLLSDTWLFRGGVWTNLTWVGPAPAARDIAGMAFDPEPEENGSVLFGGYASGVGYVNDTWVWQGWSGWVPLYPSVLPPATGYAQLAYDPTDGALVLYRPDYTNETWELSSGQWWLLNPTGSVPQYNLLGGLTYAPSLSSVVLFGGIDLTGLSDSTFTFRGNAWTQWFPFDAPPPLIAPAMSLDPSGSVPLLFGGLNTTTYFASTWVYEVPPSASLSMSASSVETSAPVTFTAHLAWGTAPYTVTFDFGDNTTATVTTTASSVSVTHAYGHPGSFVPSLTMHDSVGASANAGSPGIAVTAGPTVTATASAPAVDVGYAAAFSAHLGSSGIPPVTFSWTLGDGTTLTGQNVSHSFGAPGSYAVQVTATDSAGGTANATVTVQVNALPTVSIVVMNASTSAGTPVAFFADLAGGTGSFRYSWSFGDGSTSTSAAPAHTYNATGTYTVQVWANDSYGGGSHATLTVTVATLSTSGGAAPLWFWAALAALIALGVVAVALLVILPRYGKPPKPSP